LLEIFQGYYARRKATLSSRATRHHCPLMRPTAFIAARTTCGRSLAGFAAKASFQNAAPRAEKAVWLRDPCALRTSCRQRAVESWRHRGDRPPLRREQAALGLGFGHLLKGDRTIIAMREASAARMGGDGSRSTRRGRNWRLVTRAALANYIVVPATALGLLLLFDVHPMVAAGLSLP
jgi:hypothetical protein